MAIGTDRGCGLVEEDEVPIHGFLQGVASGAGNILVSAFQGERRLLVIEEGRLPSVAVVAGSAVVRLRIELPCMRVLVTLAAIFAGIAEVNMGHGQFHVRRLVALGACHGAMRADERKIRGCVVELCQVLPFPGGVTGQASEHLAAGVANGHALCELAPVHVVVTTCAAELVEVIQHDSCAYRRLVALAAGDRPVRFNERELRTLVRGKRVAGGLECGPGMALFTTVAPGFIDKLAGMLVFVAVHAQGKFDFVAGISPGRSMAAGALSLRVG